MQVVLISSLRATRILNVPQVNNPGQFPNTLNLSYAIDSENPPNLAVEIYDKGTVVQDGFSYVFYRSQDLTDQEALDKLFGNSEVV